jgi:hypothetical protein
MMGYDSCQQQQQQQQQRRPATAVAGGSSPPPLVDGWDALCQQSHVLLADNEQLQRDNRLLQKQKEQLQAKVGSSASGCYRFEAVYCCRTISVQNLQLRQALHTWCRPASMVVQMCLTCLWATVAATWSHCRVLSVFAASSG